MPRGGRRRNLPLIRQAAALLKRHQGAAASGGGPPGDQAATGRSQPQLQLAPSPLTIDDRRQAWQRRRMAVRLEPGALGHLGARGRRADGRRVGGDQAEIGQRSRPGWRGKATGSGCEAHHKAPVGGKGVGKAAGWRRPQLSCQGARKARRTIWPGGCTTSTGTDRRALICSPSVNKISVAVVCHAPGRTPPQKRSRLRNEAAQADETRLRRQQDHAAIALGCGAGVPIS